MTALHAAQLVEDYLRRLQIELTDLPPTRRTEIVDEIRRHIAEARGATVDESDADVMNLLDRLGDPAEIAAEARRSDDKPRPVSSTSGLGTREVLALVLLILAWPIGVFLLWSSKAWSTQQKLLGTLLPPGGYPGVLLVMSTFRFAESAADAGPAWLEITVGAVLFTLSLLLLSAPIGVAIYLATRLRPKAVQ